MICEPGDMTGCCYFGMAAANGYCYCIAFYQEVILNGMWKYEFSDQPIAILSFSPKLTGGCDDRFTAAATIHYYN